MGVKGLPEIAADERLGGAGDAARRAGYVCYRPDRAGRAQQIQRRDRGGYAYVEQRRFKRFVDRDHALLFYFLAGVDRVMGILNHFGRDFNTRALRQLAELWENGQNGTTRKQVLDKRARI